MWKNKLRIPKVIYHKGTEILFYLPNVEIPLVGYISSFDMAICRYVIYFTGQDEVCYKTHVADDAIVTVWGEPTKR